jgi:hypothetical protein
MNRRILTCLAVTLGLAWSGGVRSEELTDANYAKWRDYLLPSQKDLAYKAIPWRASFWDAVVEAQAKDKPILLWAMNGHPLGCT